MLDQSQIIMIITFFVVLVFIYEMYRNKRGNGNDTPPLRRLRRQPRRERLSENIDEDTGAERNMYAGTSLWNEEILGSIDPKIKEYHKDYVENVTRFGGSTVRNFDIEDMSTNAMFTNFRGLKRPQYIPIRATNREVPSIDVTPMKTYKRILI